jgi:hypothetical protein
MSVYTYQMIQFRDTMKHQMNNKRIETGIHLGRRYICQILPHIENVEFQRPSVAYMEIQTDEIQFAQELYQQGAYTWISFETDTETDENKKKSVVEIIQPGINFTGELGIDSGDHNIQPESIIESIKEMIQDFNESFLIFKTQPRNVDS